ncbi:MAG: SRPBCC family protein, partial [Myxococcales bacterium FL481]
MSELTIKHTINAPSAAVWAVLADFGGIHRFHPAVDRSPLLGEASGGLGAKRACHFYDGNSIVEEVVGWEEGKSMRINIVEGSMPLQCANAEIELDRQGPHRTEVTFTMRYEPKYGPVGRLMDKFMMRSKFGDLLEQVLAGLDQHTRTGALIGEGGVVPP